MRRASALFLLVTLAAVGRAAPPERTHDITPDDYASVNTITEIAVSPDGKRVAYCLATWDKKADNRRTDLWVVDTDGRGKPTQLTKDRANDRQPKWSGDGTSIYVLANRGDKPKPQVWKVPAAGGDPKAITSVEAGITGYDYAPKADAVFYSIDATATDEDDFSALRKKFDKPEYGSGKRTVSEIFRIEKDGKPEKLIAEKRYVREFAVTRDGQRIAMVTAIDDTVLKSEGESRVDVWEAGKVVTPPTDVYRAKAASPYAWLEHLAWNPDGTRFAFCAVFDAYPTEIVSGELDGSTWKVKLLNRQGKHVRGYGSPLQWMTNQSVAFLGDSHGDVPFASANLASDEARDIAFEQSAVNYSLWFPMVRPHTGIIRVQGTPTRMATLVATTPRKKEPDEVVTLVDPNPHTATWKFPTVEHVTWKAPDGTNVGGPLELPYGWKKGDKPLPLVVAIHGGPTTASYNDLRFDPHNGRMYFAAKGYAVLCPNYRGSTGYGDKFVTDLIGKENDIEVKDILAGIQHLIKEGIADPDRIAVMGWSNGGYLTNCLITLKDPPVKIRAASSGAGIVDTVAEWGFNDEPAYPRVFKKGLPWETPDVYKATSPTYGLGNVKTPTLIHVGGGDERCPPGHSRMLHRALKEYVKVPTELLVYPGEPHGLTKLSNRVAKMEWDLAWFEKHLR
ncbi:peptidase s9 : Peptidase S9 prolyl oligopeptidase active site domain protein OS=Ferrimonas balearica (strain DSM 9799 / CCM 4581 / PAT) GN=Fbal_3674 PE=4 SV=1: Gmad1: Peptidase_S9 [Gemmataceae bacterium]|nr:peptidase s9 : Peptidase S9 prolyl oligopeptidase active site domain protein OS=Ferrimonas balearica (strain DSM 9799 / CCM 4581 / PAT) GN=Fbal_3674 PE=4 SV=1: Gmad1: Peptidase_S9 [Gemmataceae bacterium]VTU02255.1 peptidase s9 : Peptidase S9 prolyl oligopeptidase active site domain protein OS=Ferrimonas balearica (strain DSM 9799 / CCM 4581 / PAT) GN=Fbal_3674 PE=4 SV=1: Gmad1: Peptidase_S9 [Gemmataceae bacterium]